MDMNFQGWDEIATNEDFFKTVEEEGTDAPSSETDGEIDKEGEEDKDDPKPKDETEDGEVDLFKEIDDDVDMNPNTDLPKSEEEEETESTVLLNSLKERGFLDFELEEGQELTEELAEELLEEKYEEALEARMAERLEALPAAVKGLVQYSLKGGDINAYLDTLGNTEITEDLDMDSEENQEAVMRAALAEEDYDAEEIEAQIEFLKDSGKLKNMATKRFNKIIEQDKKAQEELVAQQQKAIKEQKERDKKDKAETVSILKDADNIGGVIISKEAKKTIPDYMNNKTIQTKSGAVISEFQKSLFIDLPQNKKACLQLAALFQNMNEDGTFNFEGVVKNVETKVVKDLKNNLRRNKDGVPSSTSKNKSQRYDKPLADYFNT